MKTIFCIRLIFIGMSFLGLSANDYCQKVPKHIEQELVEVADKMGFKRAAQNGEFIYLKKKVTINIFFYPLINNMNLREIGSDEPIFTIKLSFTDMGLQPSARKFIIGFALAHIQQHIEDPQYVNRTYKKAKIAQSYIWPGLIWADIGLSLCNQISDNVGRAACLTIIVTLAWLSYNNRLRILDADKRAVMALKNFDDAIKAIKTTDSATFFERIGYCIIPHPTPAQRIAQIEKLKKLDPEYLKRTPKSL